MSAQLPSAPSYVALFHAGKGDAKTILSLRQAQLIQPDHADAIDLMAHTTSQQAATSIEYSQALRYNGWARAVAPMNAPIAHSWDLIHRNMGRKDLALKNFVRASSLRENCFRAAHDAANTALELNRTETATLISSAAEPWTQVTRECV